MNKPVAALCPERFVFGCGFIESRKAFRRLWCSTWVGKEVQRKTAVQGIYCVWQSGVSRTKLGQVLPGGLTTKNEKILHKINIKESFKVIVNSKFSQLSK